jgi:tRNA A-37 threonylcarbamoyl transferase component Bud32
MECDQALAAAARGVSTVTPLAVGETGRLWPGDSFLITRTLDAVEPLDSFLLKTLPTFPPQRQARVRLAVAGLLGGFVARMHDAGLRHHDLHAGNMLLRLGADDRPLLFLIDLHATELGRPLVWEASRDNLSVLGRWFSLRCERSERLRFLRNYLKSRRDWAGNGPSQSEAVLARELEDQTWQSNLGFWRNRDARCLSSNRYYHRVKRGPHRGHAVRDLDRDQLAALLANPDEVFEREGVTLIKDSPSSTVTELTVIVDGARRQAIFKRFRITTWRDPWLALVRPTGALRSWIMGQGLRERCLPTPRPLAVFHRLDHGRPAEGYLLVEKVETARDVKRFVAELQQRGVAERRRVLRDAVEQLAVLIRELHHCQLSHRDLKAANILVTGSAEFTLIDLVGVRRHRRLGQVRRMHNLTRLHVSFHRDPAISRTDKLRFLRVYLQWGLFGRKRWKEWWRQVEQATLKKLDRNKRVGRPIA